MGPDDALKMVSDMEFALPNALGLCDDDNCTRCKEFADSIQEALDDVERVVRDIASDTSICTGT